MFRGCSGLSGDQTAAIFAQLGGDGDADTQQNLTQYYETVPAHDLNIALHVDSDCMRSATDLSSQWAQERPAIEQEVARDLSDPTYKLITRMNRDMFTGTPYEHDPLGTQSSFDATTAAMLKKFHEQWYAPNNATLIIAGDVQPEATIASVKKLYGEIPVIPCRCVRRSICNRSRQRASPFPATIPTSSALLPSACPVPTARIMRPRQFWPMFYPASAAPFTSWSPMEKSWMLVFRWRDLSKSEHGNGLRGVAYEWKSFDDGQRDTQPAGPGCRARRQA